MATENLGISCGLSGAHRIASRSPAVSGYEALYTGLARVLSMETQTTTCPYRTLDLSHRCACRIHIQCYMSCLLNLSLELSNRMLLILGLLGGDDIFTSYRY